MTRPKLKDFSALEAIADDEARSCTGKQFFRRESSATNIAAQMTAKLREQMEAYKCRHCEYWHVGHARRSCVAVVNGSSVKIKPGHTLIITIKDGQIVVNQQKAA